MDRRRSASPTDCDSSPALRRAWTSSQRRAYRSTGHASSLSIRRWSAGSARLFGRLQGGLGNDAFGTVVPPNQPVAKEELMAAALPDHPASCGREQSPLEWIVRLVN